LEGKTGKSVVTGEHFLPPTSGNAPEQKDADRSLGNGSNTQVGKGRKKIA
jgi:hypothetical protein